MYNYLERLNEIFRLETPNTDYVSGGGDGVIYIGGGKYWPMIATGIHMLRQTGSTLPVEVWYRGDCEKVEPADVAGMGVTFFDVDAMGRELGDSRVPTGNPLKGGWEAKLYAMYHTKLDRVLYIDADAYVVNDPKEMFLFEDGFIFWKDLASQANSIKWDYVYPGGCKKGVPQVQGGQILIDRNKMWKVIHACFFMCQHSDYYFKKMYGDQDTWRVALAATGLPYKNLGKAEWTEGIAFVCRLNDKPLVVHRCRGKMYVQEDIAKGKTNYCNPHYRLPKEVEVFNTFAKIVNSRERSAAKVFADIYDKRLWGTSAMSGTGSTLREAQLYIDVVNKYIKNKGYSTVIDVGCGDGLVGSKIECERYIGVDCYSNLIRSNERKYGKSYLTLDITKEYGIIPSGDILLCKDVLHHWPTGTIVKWLDSLIESKRWKCILLCQDFKQIHSQQNCHLGGYRALSYNMEPLSKYPITDRVKVHHKEIGVIQCLTKSP